MSSGNNRLSRRVREGRMEYRIRRRNDRSTTPEVLTKAILAFCQKIEPTQEPIYIPCRPTEWSAPLNCHNNVAHQIALAQGSAVLGWAIWSDVDMHDAEWHCCWRSPAGETVDITPHGT